MKRFFKAKFDDWLNKRIPPSQSVTLAHRHVFIFLTRYGLVFGLLLLLMLIGATNYQNSLAFVLTFLLGSIALLAVLHTYRNLVGLSISAEPAQPVFCGDYAEFHIRLEDATGREHQAVGVGLNGTAENFTDVLAHGDQILPVHIKTKKRGWQALSRVYCCTRHPYGLLKAWSWLNLQARVLVYPKPIAPENYNPWAKSDGDEAEQSLARAGVDDFAELRSYRAGDSMRQVDWKSYAKGRGLLVKQFVEPTGEMQTFSWFAFEGTPTELRLSYLCYLVVKAEKEGIAYGLELPEKKLALNQGATHCHQCLQALALYGIRS